MPYKTNQKFFLPFVRRFCADVDDLVIQRVIPTALLVFRTEEVAVGALVEEDALQKCFAVVVV